MSNRSTIWAQLAVPFPAAGGVPFVRYDNVTIETQVQNFWFNELNGQLSVATGGDQTGTDSFNTYFNQDSYWTWNLSGQQALTQNGTTAGHTVSSSRGTSGINPQISQIGDFIGKFSAWSYTGSYPGLSYYQEIGGLNYYTAGADASAPAGLGGEMRFFTKKDNSAQTEWLRLTNTGVFTPMVPLLTLGQPLNGLLTGQSNPGGLALTFYGIFLAYTLSTTAGNQVINTPIGKFVIGAAASSVTITNSLVTANSIIQGQLETNDATATSIKSIAPAAGSFVVTLNAAATAPVTVNFVVYRTDA